MGTSGNSLIAHLEPNEVGASLNSLYCGNMAILLWTEAMKRRLSGQALFLLSAEFDEVASETLSNARSLADRAAVLGTEITADPTDLLADSPFGEFSVPEDSSDVGAILNYALGQLRGMIGAYGVLIDQVRGEDDLTYQVVVKALATAVAREDDIEGALS